MKNRFPDEFGDTPAKEDLHSAWAYALEAIRGEEKRISDSKRVSGFC